MKPGTGIDAPGAVGSGQSSFEVTVTNGADSVFVSIPNGDVEEFPVGSDGKVTVPVPAGATPGTEITITDDQIPPNSVVVEVVSTSR